MVSVKLAIHEILQVKWWDAKLIFAKLRLRLTLFSDQLGVL